MSLLFEREANLSHRHTMACPSTASFFVEIDQLEQLNDVKALQQSTNLPIKILGDGSNTLCSEHVDAIVIRLVDALFEVISETDEAVELKVHAGKNWHELVEYCCQRHWWGIENLALIPGLTGAAPIQNIGAYGVEFKDVCQSVEAVDLTSLQQFELTPDECQFGYRDSIFKQKPDWLVTAVTIKLSKLARPMLSYGPLAQLSMPLCPMDVFEQVVNVRQAKLPDPQNVPNSGSFFHNPVVEKSQYESLLQCFPNLVAYQVDDQHWKLAAGWLIDQLGFKGKQLEHGLVVYQQQALVLTNPNQVSLPALLQDADQIIQEVQQQFGVTLHQEPSIF